MNASVEGVPQEPSHRCHPQLRGLAVGEVHVSGVASPEVGGVVGKRGHVARDNEVEGVALVGLRSEHGGEPKTIRSASSLPSRIDAALIFLCLAAASVLAESEGNRLAMLVAAAWAFEVLFAAARRNVRRGRRA